MAEPSPLLVQPETPKEPTIESDPLDDHLSKMEKDIKELQQTMSGLVTMAGEIRDLAQLVTSESDCRPERQLSE